MPSDDKKIYSLAHLRPVNQLPPGYKQRGTFALELNTVQGLIKWNLIGGVLFVLVGWAFFISALTLRPLLLYGILESAQWDYFVVFGNLMAMAVAIGLHELFHGILFWAYTQTHPVFGVRLFYAYAAAPGWYLPRGQFIIVALAPLVFLTLIGFGLVAVIPPVLTLPLLFGMTTNVAGSIGDIATVIWLTRQSKRILIEDVGERIKIYSE